MIREKNYLKAYFEGYLTQRELERLAPNVVENIKDDHIRLEDPFYQESICEG